MVQTRLDDDQTRNLDICAILTLRYAQLQQRKNMTLFSFHEIMLDLQSWRFTDPNWYNQRYYYPQRNIAT